MMRSHALLIAGAILLLSTHADMQRPQTPPDPQGPPPTRGGPPVKTDKSGDAGVIPVWLSPKELGSSKISTDDSLTVIGTTLTVSPPASDTGGPIVTAIDSSTSGGGNALYASSPYGSGAVGESRTGTGVQGISAHGTGVLGVSAEAEGVLGKTNASHQGAGVKGWAAGGGTGVHGLSSVPANLPGPRPVSVGVRGQGDDVGVRGEANTDTGNGVHGTSRKGIGVLGSSEGWSGVRGSSQSSSGVSGWSKLSVGVFGESQGKLGVLGRSSEVWGTGVAGYANGTGVYGESLLPSGGIGVHGHSDNGVGIVASSKTAVGLYADTADINSAALIGKNLTAGVGIHGVSTGGLAGRFSGGVLVEGDLTLWANASKPGGGSWSVFSDRRVKKNVAPLGDALGRFLQLRGVTFEYLDAAGIGETPGTQIGMVAQDVESVFPSWVDDGPDGYKRLTFRGFEAVAVEAVRQLAAETDARITQLEVENAELRRLLTALLTQLEQK